ncbi:MAG: hypothetical protein OER21_15230 [Gemmatimonadota bacterium]|nr:hypothetical protein [Gemmatimonadota bacterium]
MTHALLGLALTAGLTGFAFAVWGSGHALAAMAAGVLATGLETGALALLTPALVPPYTKLVARWALGLGLRLLGVALVAVAVLRFREQFPPLATAIGFLGVLIPLLFDEVRILLGRMRAQG